jgi:hypothetical protein
MIATPAIAAQVNAFEKLQAKMSNQGGAGFSQQHRAQQDDTKIPGFENMSFEQRRFAQDQ